MNLKLLLFLILFCLTGCTTIYKYPLSCKPPAEVAIHGIGLRNTINILEPTIENVSGGGLSVKLPVENRVHTTVELMVKAKFYTPNAGLDESGWQRLIISGKSIRTFETSSLANSVDEILFQIKYSNQ